MLTTNFSFLGTTDKGVAQPAPQLGLAATSQDLPLGEMEVQASSKRCWCCHFISDSLSMVSSRKLKSRIKMRMKLPSQKALALQCPHLKTTRRSKS